MSKYSIISEKRRLQLIDLIKKDGKTIVSAAKKLKIKISTAKSILYSFEKNGKVLNKKKHQKTDKPKSFECANLQINPQPSNYTQKEEIKKQDENRVQQVQKEDPMSVKPLMMLNPVLMNQFWNYYPFLRPFDPFQRGNGVQ